MDVRNLLPSHLLAQTQLQITGTDNHQGTWQLASHLRISVKEQAWLFLGNEPTDKQAHRDTLCRKVEGLAQCRPRSPETVSIRLKKIVVSRVGHKKHARLGHSEGLKPFLVLTSDIDGKASCK